MSAALLNNDREIKHENGSCETLLVRSITHRSPVLNYEREDIGMFPSLFGLMLRFGDIPFHEALATAVQGLT